MSETVDKAAPCQRCGESAMDLPDFPTLCDECISLAGACCQEFEPNDDEV